MNYKRIYDDIVNRAKNRTLSGYSERHHILPKSIGGSNRLSNLVMLTAREHFICHWLLIKFTHGKDRLSMLHALMMMRAAHTGHKRYTNSRVFEQAKVALYGTNGLMVGPNSPKYGSKHSEESKMLMSESRKQYIEENPEELKRLKNMALNRSIVHKNKIIASNTGKKRTAESKKKMSDSHMGLQEGSKNGKSMPVSVDGQIYESASLAAKAKKIKPQAMHHRIKSKTERFKDYFYIMK